MISMVPVAYCDELARLTHEERLRAAQAPSADRISWLERARARLAETDFKSAWTLGRQLSLEQALTDARAAARFDQHNGGAVREPLSRRELEVANLIARGRTNREIAEELVIALSTAERHVANILGKLSLSSRTQLAAWIYQRNSP
jgi:non-specific serine/threonine protein kinase